MSRAWRVASVRAVPAAGHVWLVAPALLLVACLSAHSIRGAALALAGAALWWAGRRVRAVPASRDEAVTWAYFARAGQICGCGLVGQALGVLADRFGAPVPPGAVLMLTTPVVSWFLYRGLTHWNRFRAQVSDPGDWLNGICAVLVVVAGGMLIDDWTRPAIGRWPGVGSELWLVQIGMLLVLGGTGAAVARLTGLGRDPRIWSITVTALLVAVADVSVGVWGGPWSAVLVNAFGWPVLLAVVLAAAAWPVASRTTTRAQTAGATGAAGTAGAAVAARPVETTGLTETGETGEISGFTGLPGVTGAAAATAAGALVVLVTGVLVLTLAGVSDGHATVATLLVAAASILGCAVRMLFVYRELADLAGSRHAARTDALTGVLNRRGLTSALRASSMLGGPRTLLLVDLDRFKEINDRFGHGVGDTVLKTMTRRMQSVLPEGALLARLGGDEFAVLLSGDCDPQAESLGAELFSVACEPMVVDGHPARLSASVGLAHSGTPDLGDGELLRRADIAMYTAKRGGGGLQVFDAAADKQAKDEQAILNDLRVVLGSDAVSGAASPEIEQLVVYLQPQIDVATGGVVGAEALVRWQHPQRGLLGPAAFVELAERDGLMSSLTTFVLDQAAAAARCARGRGHDLAVSVNISASCLGLPGLRDVVESCAERHRIEPRSLILEITETTLMSDTALSLEMTHELSRRGFGISIDDYGTGHSSLSYLNDLPATELKLDRSFIARLCTDPRTDAIVVATIDLAHHLGLRVVAEGVEDQATLDRLTTLSCDISQGYLHARPQPVADFLAWLDRRAPGAGSVAGVTGPAGVTGVAGLTGVDPAPTEPRQLDLAPTSR